MGLYNVEIMEWMRKLGINKNIHINILNDVNWWTVFKTQCNFCLIFCVVIFSIIFILYIKYVFVALFEWETFVVVRKSKSKSISLLLLFYTNSQCNAIQKLSHTETNKIYLVYNEPHLSHIETYWLYIEIYSHS